MRMIRLLTLPIANCKSAGKASGLQYRHLSCHLQLVIGNLQSEKRSAGARMIRLFTLPITNCKSGDGVATGNCYDRSPIR
jgi:hypothetical protein